MLVKILLSFGLLAAPFASVFPLDTTADSSTSAVDVPDATKDVAAASAESAKPAESQTWTLRYKFLPGQQLRYKNTENVTLDAMQGELQKVDVTDLDENS